MRLNQRWQCGFLIVILSVLLLNRVCRDTKSEAFDPPIVRLESSEFRLMPTPIGRRFRFSKDGSLIAGANGRQLKLWTFPEGKLIHEFAGFVNRRCIGFSDDGRELLALNRNERAIYRFDVITGELRSRVALQEMEGDLHFDFSSDGRWLYVRDWGVSVWDTATGKRQLERIEPRFRPAGAAISDEAVLTIWNDGFLARYDVLTGKKISKATHRDRLHGLISDLEGVRFAAYCSEAEAVVFWDATSSADDWVGSKIPMAKRDWNAREAMISDDQSRLVFKAPGQKSWHDNSMAVFDISRGEIVSSFETPEIPWIGESVISPDGKYVFPTGSRSVFCPINVATGQPIRKIECHVDEIQALSFTPDGHRLLVASRSKRQAWSTATGQATRLLGEYSNATPAIVAVNNCQALVSGGLDPGVRLHNIDTGEVIRSYEPGHPHSPSDLQFSKDKKAFTAAVRIDDGLVARRWDIETGRLEAEAQISVFQGGVMYRPFQLPTLAIGGSRAVRVEWLAKSTPPQANLVVDDWTDGSQPSIMRRLGLPALELTAISWSADHRYLAATVNGSINQHFRQGAEERSSYLVVWDLLKNTRRACVKRETEKRMIDLDLVAISPDGKLAATMNQQSRIEVWAVSTEELLQTFQADSRGSVIAFNCDGSILASGHVDGQVNLWSTSKAKAHTSK